MTKPKSTKSKPKAKRPAPKKKRTQWSDFRKTQAVMRAFKRGSIKSTAADVGVAESNLRKWCRDPRYGGKPGSFADHSATSNGLPTTRKSYTRSRELVATSFACPHCGGPISKGA